MIKVQSVSQSVSQSVTHLISYYTEFQPWDSSESCEDGEAALESECNGCQSSRGGGQMLTRRKKDECKDNPTLQSGMLSITVIELAVI